MVRLVVLHSGQKSCVSAGNLPLERTPKFQTILWCHYVVVCPRRCLAQEHGCAFTLVCRHKLVSAFDLVCLGVVLESARRLIKSRGFGHVAAKTLNHPRRSNAFLWRYLVEDRLDFCRYFFADTSRLDVTLWYLASQHHVHLFEVRDKDSHLVLGLWYW